MKIKAMNRPGFHAATVSLLYYKGTHLDLVLDRLAVAVDRAYREGANIVILSDRGVDENHAAIPLCWRCLPWSSTWFAPGSAPPYLSSWNPLSPGGPPLRRPAGLWPGQ